MLAYYNENGLIIMNKSDDISTIIGNKRSFQTSANILRPKRKLKTSSITVKDQTKESFEVIVHEDISDKGSSRSKKVKSSTNPVFGQLEKHKKLVNTLLYAYSSSENTKLIDNANEVLLKHLELNRRHQRKNQAELPLIKFLRNRNVFEQALNMAIKKGNMLVISRLLGFRSIRENEGVGLYLASKLTNDQILLESLSGNGLSLSDVINMAENNLFQRETSLKSFNNSLNMIIAYSLDRTSPSNLEQMHRLFFDLPFAKNNAVNFYLTALEGEDQKALSYLKENDITVKSILSHAFKTTNLPILEKLLRHEKIKAEINSGLDSNNPLKILINEHYQNALLKGILPLIKVIEEASIVANK